MVGRGMKKVMVWDGIGVDIYCYELTCWNNIYGTRIVKLWRSWAMYPSGQDARAKRTINQSPRNDWIPTLRRMNIRLEGREIGMGGKNSTAKRACSSNTPTKEGSGNGSIE